MSEPINPNLVFMADVLMRQLELFMNRHIPNPECTQAIMRQCYYRAKVEVILADITARRLHPAKS